MKRTYAFLTNFLLVACAIWVLATPNQFIRSWVTAIDNFIYDAHLNLWSKKQKIDNTPIAIIDIDNKSLLEQGAWPWPKAKFVQLVQQIQMQNAAIIAFTFIFSESKPDIATNYLKKILTHKSHDTELINVLNELIYQYEGKELFADVIGKNNVVLGLMFNQSSEFKRGALPAPAMIVSDSGNLNNLLIPSFNGYIANLPILQENAKSVGFVTGIEDSDGIIRRSPLLAVYKSGIYLSLALQATKSFFHYPKIEIQFTTIGNNQAVSQVILGNKNIHTDNSGAILIPYLNSNVFPHYSATDLLNQRLPKNLLSNKLVFIGISIPGLGDLHPTPLSSLSPSVDIQANIASAIMNDFVLYTPYWSKGVEITLTILLGILLAVILPFLRAIALAITLIVLIGTTFYVDNWLWNKGLIFSFSVPLLMIIGLITMNLIYGFLFESRQHDKLYKQFSEYVPSEYAKQLSEKYDENELTTEICLITVMFIDIRHFTSMAETLNVIQVKELLTKFFTPLTEIIVKYNGTVDKYVGDMIVAFWKIKADDFSQDQLPLEAALAIQDKIKELKLDLIEYNLPIIEAGIGINTGEVILGEIGSHLRRSFTVLGDTVNLGSRIQDLTKFYKAKIIIGENTYFRIRDKFIFRHLDKVIVKGKQTPTEVYQLICKKEIATPELLRELSLHELALTHYYKQEWASAYKMFSSLTRTFPKVKIYYIYLNRIKEFMQKPPGANWNGTYIKLKK